MSRIAGVTILLLALGALSGCQEPGTQVLTLGSACQTDLSAEETVIVMRRAGFTNAEIIELGPDVRNALATAGGARIRVGQKLEVVFAVDGTSLHASSRRRGAFIYDLTARSLVLPAQGTTTGPAGSTPQPQGAADEPPTPQQPY